MRRIIFLASLVSLIAVSLSVTNIIFQIPESSASLTAKSRFLGDDVIMIPDNIRKLEAEIAASRAVSGNEPAWNRTSDFMLGTVAVAVILPECNGTGDPCSEQ